jgi:triacylglycerol lipase
MTDAADFPIVLAHGIARFDFLRDSVIKRLQLFLADLSFAPDRTHYFKGIATHLKSNGFETYHTSVSFAPAVEQRSAELRQEILRILKVTGKEKVHIIGHSMGGLDSRTMIVSEDMADHVASLTTIGTPHLGTSFAEWGLSHGGSDIIRAIRRFLDMEGFLTLTAEARQAFNESARNLEATNDVVYQTYAGAQQKDLIFTPLKPSWEIINDAEGANDGLVSVASQKWVSELVSDEGVVKGVRQHDFPVPADHLNQIGWWDMSELRKLKWWRISWLREKRRYETAVKNAYLKIARQVTDGR